ncbi:addiction module protein [Mucilaginibacter flavus]|uniref:addiction module protein n=1 Tax=Mucilaginibacter flavus TaxID=931504 RepID=UPI0025B58176|nr:addiction module protein [Mucilaginibacter flavus]MDN3582663.1 addiction module protein [Mucilaginibacter flavus]
MSVQYISDTKGQVTAVQVPIKEWEMIKSKYPDVDNIDTSIPEWHKEIIDERLEALKRNPDMILPIETLFDELDN